MNIATILVSGVHAHTSNAVIVPQGIVGATVTFDFKDPLWEGLSKTAVFQGDVTRDVIVKGNTAIIPAETVANEGTTLKVGVYGVDDKNNLAIPTLWATIGKISSAADPSGDPGTEPDLPIWAQLADEVDRLKRTDSGGNVDQTASVLMADMVLADTANAPKKLPIKTHASGKDQPIHPKVLYFPELFGGHKFWMAYTPYPNGADREENPCIAYSNDMVTWITPEGVTNPLDVPANTGDSYLSDTHLVYNTDTKMLEIWYRGAGSVETIYRRRSSDGVTWGDREVMFRGSSGLSSYLSPAIIYEDGIYKIWAGSGNPSGYLKYYESADGTAWELKATTNLEGWHFDVIHTEEGYEAFISDTQPGASVSYSKSADGITWEDKTQLLTAGASGNWDASRLYRTSAVKINGYYFVYYTGVAADGSWGIGLTVSTVANEVTSIRGYTDGTAIETTQFQMMQSLLFRVNALSKSAGGETGNGNSGNNGSTGGDDSGGEETVPCTGISLPANTLTFTAEGTQTLTATVTPEGCTDTVTWESSNTSVATVNGGMVTAIGNGDAVITATCGKHSANCSVSVSGIELNILRDVGLNDGYVNYETGATGANTSGVYSDMGSIGNIGALMVHCKTISGDTGDNQRIAYYDEDGAFIKCDTSCDAVCASTTPDNAAQFRIGSLKQNLSEINVYTASDITDFSDNIDGQYYVAATGSLTSENGMSCIKVRCVSGALYYLTGCISGCIKDEDDTFVSALAYDGLAYNKGHGRVFNTDCDGYICINYQTAKKSSVSAWKSVNKIGNLTV